MTAAGHYEQAMRRALELAANGPLTGGNPRVGCVLLSPDGEIVAEGWHRGAGTAHAEVDALSRVSTGSTSKGRSTSKGGSTSKGRSTAGLTAVVTLEPCNHTGRTGPCSEALIAAGVARVVYAVSDPGRASGGGAERLREAGVEVIAGVLAEEAETFLEEWLTATRRGTPWVTVKWAATLDGRAAAADGSSQWITGTASRQRVHEQRAQSDAIVVGTGTVLADDPSLTARGDAGELLPHQPLPVVIGERGIPAGAKLRDRPVLEAASRDLPAILRDLYSRDIRRVYVEGGPTLASAFIAAGLVDEYAVYVAPKVLGGPRLAVTDIGVGTIADARELTITSVESLGDDILITARPKE